jgi:hypothetical protein
MPNLTRQRFLKHTVARLSGHRTSHLLLRDNGSMAPLPARPSTDKHPFRGLIYPDPSRYEMN